jgi:hypothetical protein
LGEVEAKKKLRNRGIIYSHSRGRIEEEAKEQGYKGLRHLSNSG